MITPIWVRATAAYSSEMHRHLTTAADTLDNATCPTDGGTFFGSLHGTLCHLLWGDTAWMSRFDA